MAALSDHDRRDAEHALRAETAILIQKYVRRVIDLGKAYVKEELDGAARDGRPVNGTSIGRAAAHRAAVDYFGIEAAGEPSRLSRVQPLQPKAPERTLDFDIETVAAGFADPDWVPQKITCVAWSWIGEDLVESRVCGPEGIFGDPSRRKTMLEPLLDAILEADVVTGHNIARFDLPIVNAECMRLGLEPIRRVRIQDTMRLVRAKGFKKGQDAIASLFKVPEQKLSLNWQEWQDAYDEDGWGTIRRRCESDVTSHKQIRERLLQADLIKATRWWNG